MAVRQAVPAFPMDITAHYDIAPLESGVPWSAIEDAECCVHSYAVN